MTAEAQTVADPKPMTSDEARQAEREKRQRLRSIAIAVALLVLVGLFYAATIVRLGGHALNRPM